MKNDKSVDYELITLDRAFILNSGIKMCGLNLAYKTFGTLNADKSNVILICHSLSSNMHVCSSNNDEPAGWWEEMVGSGKNIDTNKYFVICINNIGGCFGSTGPLSMNPDTNKIYGKYFPEISINDIVRSQKQVLDHLGIASLYAVVGSSMGGIIALEWATAFHGMIKYFISISSCGTVPPSVISAHTIQREIMQLANCDDDSAECTVCQQQFLLARKIGLMHYKSPTEINKRFSGNNKEIDSYLNYNSIKFTKSFNRYSYLTFLQAMDNYQPQDLNNVSAKTLIISVDSDILFPEDSQVKLYEDIKSNNQRCYLIKHSSHYGHDAFYKDKIIGKYMEDFLNNGTILLSKQRKLGILGAVGNTPLVQLSKLEKANHLNFNLYAKLESHNPGGSIKDRPSKAILLKALQLGTINEKTTIIEYSSGNMGIGLSQACSYLGLKFLCLVDPRCNQETLRIMESYGTEILKIELTGANSNDYLPAAIKRIKELLQEIPNSYWTNQHGNIENANAHFHTFEEIIKKIQHVDYLFCATSTCGTLRGSGEYIKAHQLDTKIIAVDALGSAIFSDQKHKRIISGHGAGIVPTILDKSLVNDVILTTAEQSILGARHLLKTESILAGGSSGALISAVLSHKDKIQPNSNCVVIIADRGERYLNTIYSDQWCLNHLPDFTTTHKVTTL